MLTYRHLLELHPCTHALFSLSLSHTHTLVRAHPHTRPTCTQIQIYKTPHTARPVKNLKTRRTPPHHHHEVSSRGETAPFVPTTVPMERVTALSVLLIPSRPCPASSPQGRVEGDQFQMDVLLRLRLQPDPLLDDSSGSRYRIHGGCLGGGGRRETHTHYY